MAFTDDDLKRLKIRLTSETPLGIETRRIADSLGIYALLARLDAAEQLRVFSKHLRRCKGIYETCECGFWDADQAWLKSAGR